MKKITLLFISFFIAAYAGAQQEEIIVLSSNGFATYSLPDGSDAKDILPGLSIPLESNIFLDDESRVRLIVNQKSILLTGPGRYKMNEIYQPDNKKAMSFSARFWNFVMDGMGSTKDKKDLVKYHREYMQIHGGVKGFTSIDSSVLLVSPVAGKISSGMVLFQWATPGFAGKSHISLLKQNRLEVYSAIVDDLEHEVSLKKLDLKGGERIFWSVHIKEGGTMHKSEAEFYYTPGEEANIAERLLYLEDYIGADPSEKEWMKAVALEMEEYYFEAGKIYRALLEKDPNNLFLQKSYALFLIRQNQTETAREIWPGEGL